MYWFDGNPGVGQEWTTAGAGVGMPKLFQMTAAPPGLETRNLFKVLEENDEDNEEDNEIPALSLEDYPEINAQNLDSKGIPVPKVPAVNKHDRIGRKGQGERKAMRKAFNQAKKEAHMNEHVGCACHGCDGDLMPLIREQPDAVPELHPLDGTERWMMKCSETGCTRIRSVLDSGATDSCAPDAMCVEVKSRASEGSRRGQMYTAAGGKKLPNRGEKDICMITPYGQPVMTNWQTVDITRPLSSVRQICLQGNRVVFGAQGGVIQHLESGQETHFGIEDNVYVLDLWLPPTQKASDFAGLS